MPKNSENYEDQLKREFEDSQVAEQETVSDLGKVKLDRGIDITNDPEIRRVTNSMDYVNIPLDCLPSGGMYYPENTRITIRSAKVGEIREFAVIDEENPYDVHDKMIYIASQCVKLFFGNTPGHYKDIIEDDMLQLILKVSELTYVDGQNSIKLQVPEGACSTPGCIPQQEVTFSSDKLIYNSPTKVITKYYDPVSRCFNVQTKSFGAISLYPPTIGVTSVIQAWLEEEKKANRKIDAALIKILPYTIKEWRGLTTKNVFSKLTELAGWSIEKFSLVDRLIDEINLKPEYEIIETCAQCGGELRIPVIFPGGLKSLFVPTISDLGNELL